MANLENEQPDKGLTVPVAEAAQLTANWRAYLANPIPGLNKKAFLIPIADITAILQNNEDIDGIRGYLTMEDPEDINSVNMIVVPVKDGKDVVRTTVSRNNRYGGEDDSNVYNDVRPCPSTCDDDSELGNDPLLA